VREGGDETRRLWSDPRDASLGGTGVSSRKPSDDSSKQCCLIVPDHDADDVREPEIPSGSTEKSEVRGRMSRCNRRKPFRRSRPGRDNDECGIGDLLEPPVFDRCARHV
jgi:hypothetical protein